MHEMNIKLPATSDLTSEEWEQQQAERRALFVKQRAKLVEKIGEEGISVLTDIVMAKMQDWKRRGKF